MKILKYFYNDPNGLGIVFADTKEKALKGAKRILELEREEALADDEWADNVDEIFWGEVHGYAKRTLCEPAPEGSNFDEYVDFDLVEANFEK